MSESNEKNYTFIGKVKKFDGANGSFTKIMFDEPTNKDGEPNQFFKGHLIFIDAVTGDQYRVRQISMVGTSENMRKVGFVNSLSINFDDPYMVEKLT